MSTTRTIRTTSGEQIALDGDLLAVLDDQRPVLGRPVTLQVRKSLDVGSRLFPEVIPYRPPAAPGVAPPLSA